MLTNEQLYQALSEDVTNKLYPEEIHDQANYGPLELNYFSACFCIRSSINNKEKGVYVKIPKKLLFNKTNNIMPFSNEDRRLAEDEYNSLVHLSEYWPDNEFNVHFIKPLFFLKEYNAIITEQIYADHFFKLFRKSDLDNSIINRSTKIKDILKRLGATLSKFHKTSLKECRFNNEPTILKMTNSCLKLKSRGVSQKYLDLLIFKLKNIKNHGLKTYYANTLKGFDIRQVFIDKQEKVYLLDPGKIKFDCVEMDLARFITTCRLLYWGSTQLFFQRSPNPIYEECFIKSYYGNKKMPSDILSLLIIKELLKHWKMAHKVTALKPWPSSIKMLARRFYIDPFYKRQVNSELIQLEI